MATGVVSLERSEYGLTAQARKRTTYDNMEPASDAKNPLLLCVIGMRFGIASSGGKAECVVHFDR